MRCTADGRPVVGPCCTDNGADPCPCPCHDGGTRRAVLVEVLARLDALIASDTTEATHIHGLARAARVVKAMIEETP